MIPILTRLFPAWVLWLAVAGVVGGLFIQNAMLRSTLHKERAAYAQAVAEAKTRQADAEARNRVVEQELRNAQETHAAEVAAIRESLDRARDRAAVESGRLQDAARAAAARARAQCADSAVAGLRPPADDPIGVLADVLARADARAGVLAEHADRARIAGLACEAEYERARRALMD